MATPLTESTPLLPPKTTSAADRSSMSPTAATSSLRRPARSVTFNANPVSKTFSPEREHDSSAFPYRPKTSHFAPGPQPSSSTLGTSPGTAGSSSFASGSGGGQPGQVLSALKSNLRRRNSGGPGGGPPLGATTGMASSSSLPVSSASSSSSSLAAAAEARKGPQRTTKTAQKLKLLPAPATGEDGDEEQDEESGRDVYSQYTRIKDPTARRDAARLGKADRARLPRVTAYCTANRYNLDGLMHFLKGRGRTKGANPKRIDECIYTPYMYGGGGGPAAAKSSLSSSSSREQPRRLEPRDSGYSEMSETESAPGRGGQYQLVVAQGDNVGAYEARRYTTGSVDAAAAPGGFGLGDGMMTPALERPGQEPRLGYGNGFSQDQRTGRSGGSGSSGASGAENADSAAVTPAFSDDAPDFDIEVHTAEVFLFEYGVVVIWGMSTAQELRFLKEIRKFELESLPPDQVETEFFNFYYTREYQPRIYNDFITLRDKHSYMTKLAISHALAQSVKTSLFEESIATTIETCKEIPEQIARTGHIHLSRTQINMQIGELFILRISVHLNGAVLDSPELFWVEPQLEPVYQAVRSYLEMDQRVGLLTDRLDVIADLLAVLKEQLNHGHGEKLEWIVIILIATEILVACVNIVVDLYAGV